VSLRIGLGYDSHRFTPGRPLVLGGVTIPHPVGLAGHSDADAVAHALTDAILGAAGLGDIGAHFPPTDPAWKDADSIRLLQLAHERVRESGWRLLQADITVVAESPRVGPHASDMAARLAAATGAHPTAISVKGKTNEGMGWIGRGEGVAVIAIASLEPLR
jgi:2-C-methyl-D-erythritol 2,4-cyclodiphosphate synthase